MPAKNIIIIGSAYPLRGGGIATFNERLAQEFNRENYNVTIFSFSLQYPRILFPGSSQYSSEPPPADLNIISAINSVNPFNWIKVGRKIKKLKPDIVVVRYWLPFMGPSLGTILRIIKKNKHSEIVCIADNIIPHEKRPGDNLLTNYFLKPVDRFITMSEKVFADLKKFTDKPAKIVAHPLYDNFGEKISKGTARQKFNISSDENIMLFFGFIRKYKGLDILLEAMSILKSKGLSNIPKLIIAGEFYGDEKYYNDLISKFSLEKYLILNTRFISDKEVKYFFSAADVVVQPYREATQSGVTPLAYHFEVPMIVTNVGGLPALVPNHVSGLVCEPNAESVANAIINFFSNEKTRFNEGLQMEKKKYSWEKLVFEIVNNQKNDLQK
ncbi:MAG: glycosyltransferase family 4 protein [Bacteroidetes bacterium]|nr:glycosyltransferase family 4 protein [Bacteroidota bacterium]